MDPSDEPSGERAGLDRRTLLALASGLAGGLAGCSGFGGDSTPTDSPEPTTATRAPTDSTRTLFPTPTEPPTPTEAPTETPSPTPATTPVGSATWDSGSSVLTSPSSEIDPEDGFADVSWLTDGELQVIKVTNLNSSGEGSLRDALSRSGRRVVVFEVGGTIDLEGDHLSIEQDDVLVAGQTAPSPGITLVRGALRANARNVIVQHVRARPGVDPAFLPRGVAMNDYAPTDERAATDSMHVGSEGRNVVFDHCTATWGTDENMSTGGNPGRNITFSNNLIAEGLANTPLHPESGHAYGTLVFDGTERVAVLGNLYAHNLDRHPRMKEGTTTVAANNLVYNFGGGITIGGDDMTGTKASVVGNLYRAGPITSRSSPIVEFDDAATAPVVHISGNRTQPAGIPIRASRVYSMDERPLWPEGFEALPARRVYDHVLATAGARPADRTEHDARIVTDVRERTGEVIDSQDEVGGYPDLGPTERSLDVPESGLAGWLQSFTEAAESGGGS